MWMKKSFFIFFLICLTSIAIIGDSKCPEFCRADSETELVKKEKICLRNLLSSVQVSLFAAHVAVGPMTKKRDIFGDIFEKGWRFVKNLVPTADKLSRIAEDLYKNFNNIGEFAKNAISTWFEFGPKPTEPDPKLSQWRSIRSESLQCQRKILSLVAEIEEKYKKNEAEKENTFLQLHQKLNEAEKRITSDISVITKKITTAAEKQFMKLDSVVSALLSTIEKETKTVIHRIQKNVANMEMKSILALYKEKKVVIITMDQLVFDTFTQDGFPLFHILQEQCTVNHPIFLLQWFHDHMIESLGFTELPSLNEAIKHFSYHDWKLYSFWIASIVNDIFSISKLIGACSGVLWEGKSSNFSNQKNKIFDLYLPKIQKKVLEDIQVFKTEALEFALQVLRQGNFNTTNQNLPTKYGFVQWLVVEAWSTEVYPFYSIPVFETKNFFGIERLLIYPEIQNEFLIVPMFYYVAWCEPFQGGESKYEHVLSKWRSIFGNNTDCASIVEGTFFINGIRISEITSTCKSALWIESQSTEAQPSPVGESNLLPCILSHECRLSGEDRVVSIHLLMRDLDCFI